MKYDYLLDRISESIKSSEDFLRNYPISIEVTLHKDLDFFLKWNPTEKKIFFNSGSICKPLIEHRLSDRKIGYCMLLDFIKLCIDEEVKSSNLIELVEIHNKLSKFLQENS